MTAAPAAVSIVRRETGPVGPACLRGGSAPGSTATIVRRGRRRRQETRRVIAGHEDSGAQCASTMIRPLVLLAGLVALLAVRPVLAQDVPIYTDGLQSGFQNFSYGGGS